MILVLGSGLAAVLRGRLSSEVGIQCYMGAIVRALPALHQQSIRFYSTLFFRFGTLDSIFSPSVAGHAWVSSGKSPGGRFAPVPSGAIYTESL